MHTNNVSRDPLIVRAGWWLTKRRGVLLSPLFAVTLLSARFSKNPWLELTQDVSGLAFILGGTWLRLVAASYHDSSHHSEPITAGPYAWVRHPLYISNFLLGLGIVFLGGWWTMVLVYILFFLPIHMVIARSEEVHLTHLYGEKYTTYRQRVPAVFPWRSYRGPRYGGRSDFKLQKGRERLKAAGYLAGVAGILLFKECRGFIKTPSLGPLPLSLWVGGISLTIAAVICRPFAHRPWVRGCQTALAVISVLFLAVHVPGVWPTQGSNPVSPPR